MDKYPRTAEPYQGGRCETVDIGGKNGGGWIAIYMAGPQPRRGDLSGERRAGDRGRMGRTLPPRPPVGTGHGGEGADASRNAAQALSPGRRCPRAAPTLGRMCALGRTVFDFSTDTTLLIYPGAMFGCRFRLQSTDPNKIFRWAEFSKKADTPSQTHGRPLGSRPNAPPSRGGRGAWGELGGMSGRRGLGERKGWRHTGRTGGHRRGEVGRGPHPEASGPSRRDGWLCGFDVARSTSRRRTARPPMGQNAPQALIHRRAHSPGKPQCRPGHLLEGKLGRYGGDFSSPKCERWVTTRH